MHLSPSFPLLIKTSNGITRFSLFYSGFSLRPPRGPPRMSVRHGTPVSRYFSVFFLDVSKRIEFLSFNLSERLHLKKEE
jgi:hypothetical protein